VLRVRLQPRETSTFNRIRVIGLYCLAEGRSCGIEATRHAAVIDVNGGMLIRYWQ
jgi:hypothetical protein